MKKIVGFLLVGFFLWSGEVLAQAEEAAESQEQVISRVEVEEKDKGEKRKVKSVERSNVYGNEADKPTSPFANKNNNDIGGFTVTKFKESKTKKKLRRGESQTRFSVPTPKGKPLKHKKKRKFKLFE